MVFPTGYLHETFVDPADNDQRCYTASTFQFNHPRQVNLYRAYLSSFSMSHYGMQEPCLHRIRAYATLLSTFQEPEGRPDEAHIHAEGQRVLKLIDADMDGRLNFKEFHDHFCVGKAKRKRVMKEADFMYGWYRGISKDVQRELMDESMAVYAEDALQYHDVDRDGAVTAEELSQSFLQWSLVQYRLAEMRRLARIQKPSKWLKAVAKVEADMLSKHYCEDASSCEALSDLEAHVKKLKDSGKSAIARASQKVTGMLESEEGEDGEEVLTVHDRESGQQERRSVSELRNEL